jgi:hypothetical protein
MPSDCAFDASIVWDPDIGTSVIPEKQIGRPKDLERVEEDMEGHHIVLSAELDESLDGIRGPIVENEIGWSSPSSDIEFDEV